MLMRRLIIPFAAAALVAACYDASSAPPSSLLAPRSAVHDEGIPPAPPVSGDGFANFDASGATDASEIGCPTVHDSFNFAYDYFNNGPKTNAYLHIRVDGNGLDVSVHETTKKITANGTLNRPTFSFQIDEVLDGTIATEAAGVPRGAVLTLAGVLTVDGQSCPATATFTAQLTGVKPPPVDVPPV